MSVNKLISAENVIINLIESLKLDHTKHKPMFMRWIVEAEKQIGSYYQYVRKIAVIDIKNCIAEVPEDAKWVELALLGDYGCECQDLFKRFCGGALNAAVTTGNIDSTSFLVVDLPSVATTTTGNYNFGLIDYKISNNKIVLDNNYNGQKLTVQYLAIETDCDGIPLVGENHILALEEYCLWMFKRRNIRSGIDVGVCRDHERRWHELCASARADDAMPSGGEQEIAARMINNPYAGRGLKLVPMRGFGLGTGLGGYY